MSVVCRRNAVVLGSIALLCSIALGDWKKMTSGTVDDLKGVSFPTGTMVGYAVGASPLSGGSVYKTTDGGATWVFQNPSTMMGLKAVFFTDDNIGVAVGDVGAIVKTTDGGTTWTKVTSPVTDPLTYVAFPSKGQTGWIGAASTGQAYVLKSTDGGSTWTKITVGHQLDVSTGASFTTDVHGVVFGLAGTVLGTIDGNTFTNQTSGAPNATLSGAAFSPTNSSKGYLIGKDLTSNLGIIRFTSTFGPTWDTLVRAPFVSGGFHGICMPFDTLAFISGDSGFIAATESDTDFWRTLDTVTTNSINALTFPHGGDTGYAVGGNGTILKTTDAGRPWAPGVAEGKAPVVPRAGLRVLSNPGRYGISVHSDANVPLTVFDA
ncbi:MAG TPA: YCF48-related protein, partial [bacterium]|nr:YCF48-related protein [bacterium]